MPCCQVRVAERSHEVPLGMLSFIIQQASLSFPSPYQSSIHFCHESPSRPRPQPRPCPKPRTQTQTLSSCPTPQDPDDALEAVPGFITLALWSKVGDLRMGMHAHMGLVYMNRAASLVPPAG